MKRKQKSLFTLMAVFLLAALMTVLLCAAVGCDGEGAADYLAKGGKMLETKLLSAVGLMGDKNLGAASVEKGQEQADGPEKNQGKEQADGPEKNQGKEKAKELERDQGEVQAKEQKKKQAEEQKKEKEKEGERKSGKPKEQEKEEKDQGKEKEAENNEGNAAPHTVMTMVEAVNYIKTMPPKNLGLSGNSMSSYEIYAADEAIPVNGLLCTKLSVYQSSEVSATNTFQGIYLLSRDGGHLYRLDPEDNRVTELPLSGY